MRNYSFQASGKDFHASKFAAENVLAFDAGQIATFGGHQGQISPHGAALFLFNADCMDEDKSLLVFCRQMAAILDDLRTAGAKNFILHVKRVFTHNCNEELTRQELREIAGLDCHLFYTAREPDAIGSV